MKVLGIVCSARKGGNTEILVKEALDSAKKAGAQTELVSVIGKTITPCDGCGVCHKKGVCRINDDMQAIYKQIEAADAIIFGSPVYFGGVSAQAKAVIDRTFLFIKGRKLQGKVVAPVLALRRVGGGQTYSHLCGYFVVQGMIPVKGVIGYGREKGEVLHGVGRDIDSTAMEEARTTGREVVEMVKRLSKSKD